MFVVFGCKITAKTSLVCCQNNKTFCQNSNFTFFNTNKIDTEKDGVNAYKSL